MADTSARTSSTGHDTKLRLRRDVFDAVVTERNLGTVNAQTAHCGVSRATMWRARGGIPVGYAAAIRMSDALGVPLFALFERTDAD